MLETIYQRRSIRKYKDLPVPGEQVNKLIQAALLAPTSHSGQPWEFIAVDDKELLEQLSYAKLGAVSLKNAPLGIVILADPEKSDVWVEDTSIATAFIWLTAQSLGLGACWIQIRERRHNAEESADAYVRQILDIPENRKVESIIAVGYPNESRQGHREEELRYEKVFVNVYGNKYQRV